MLICEKNDLLGLLFHKWKKICCEYGSHEVLCKTVGTLMRMYFEGDTDALADALRAQERAEDYAERFFGRRTV